MKTLKLLGQLAAVMVFLLALLSVVAGKSVSHSVAYVGAVAQQVFDGFVKNLPSDVRDKARDRELRQARSEIVDWRVKLILSERKLEQLRASARNSTAAWLAPQNTRRKLSRASKPPSAMAGRLCITRDR